MPIHKRHSNVKIIGTLGAGATSDPIDMTDYSGCIVYYKCSSFQIVYLNVYHDGVNHLLHQEVSVSAADNAFRIPLVGKYVTITNNTGGGTFTDIAIEGARRIK
jgi:hypothetical protein